MATLESAGGHLWGTWFSPPPNLTALERMTRQNPHPLRQGPPLLSPPARKTRQNPHPLCQGPPLLSSPGRKTRQNPHPLCQGPPLLSSTGVRDHLGGTWFREAVTTWVAPGAMAPGSAPGSMAPGSGLIARPGSDPDQAGCASSALAAAASSSGLTHRTKPKVPVPPHTPLDAWTFIPALASFRWYWCSAPILSSP